ncbi:MAG: hypothetical protein GY844_17395 [Bradyrhizobium sp.]|nr:hypothetical protein [Bradyrhizobium sp.]
MTRLHSFDVFDTALVRRVAAPTDVFRLIGSRLAAQLEIEDKARFVEDFLLIRLLAEQECLKTSEECTLHQIWNVIRRELPNLALQNGEECELSAERSVLVPNPAVRNKVDICRRSGGKVVFTSDTYLPGSFVKAMLVQHGIAGESDETYVSSEFNATKRSGRLFELVLQREGIPASEITHYGDNIESDFNVPRRLGISAEIINSRQLNTSERAVASARSSRQLSSSVLAGAMRAFRLGSTNEAVTDRRALVASFLGPCTLIWISWVLGRARRDGVRRLYFASRDGYLAWRAARAIAGEADGVECRYLKISRQAILFPSTEHLSAEGAPWLQRSGEAARLQRLVRRLSLDWDEVATSFSPLAGSEGDAKVLQSRKDWQLFWEIVQSAPLAKQIGSRIESQRSLVSAYLKNEGLHEGRAALVDIGWHLTVQSGLQKLLRWNEMPEIAGYYLGLSCSRSTPAVAGPASALLYDLPMDRQNATQRPEIFNRGHLVEHLFGLAPHGTVSGYARSEDGVQASCANVSDAVVGLSADIAQLVEDFCIANRDCVEPFSDPDLAAETLDALMRSWFSRPNRAALEALSCLHVSSDPHNLGARPMLESWRMSEAAKMLIPRRWHYRLGIRIDYPIWPEAATLLPGPWPVAFLRLRDGWSG